MKEHEAFKIGDEVEWSSQAAGYRKVKRGVVVQVVAPGSRPDREAFLAMYTGAGVGCARDHESYVVQTGKRGGFYWPRVAHLRCSGVRERKERHPNDMTAEELPEHSNCDAADAQMTTISGGESAQRNKSGGAGA